MNAEDDVENGVAPAHSPEFVRSLERGFAVIKAFGPGRDRLTLSEVAKATHLNAAAARRFLLTLVDLGYVRTEGRDYLLRPRILELGYSYLSGLSLPEVAQPYVEEFVAEVNEWGSIAVLDDLEIVYVVHVPTQRNIAIPIRIGTRLPAYCTALGRVLLATLPERDLDDRLARTELEQHTDRTVTDAKRLKALIAKVRSSGYSFVDRELEEGLRSLAVPVRDGSDAVVAALNVSGPAARISVKQMTNEFLPKLTLIAAQVQNGLSARNGAAPQI